MLLFCCGRSLRKDVSSLAPPSSHVIRQISTHNPCTKQNQTTCLLSENTVSVPFASIPQPIRPQPPHPDGFHPGDRFPSPLFLNFAQALASGSSAFLYLLFLSYRDGTLGTLPLSSILGLHHFSASLRAPHDQTSQQKPIQEKIPNGDGNWTRNASEQDVKKEVGKASSWRKSLPALLVQVSLFQTLAGPLGFFALRHISYPTMVLGKVSLYLGMVLTSAVMQARAGHDAQCDTLSAEICSTQILGGCSGHGGDQHVHALRQCVKKRRVE